jgi:hypothetical protein
VCGEPAAFETTETLPVAAPRAVGEKVTDTLQLAAAARLAPQVVPLTANGAVAAMLEMLSAAVPEFVKVMARAAEVVPLVWLPKAREAGASATTGAGAAVAVPLNVTAAFPLLALEAIVSVALRAPVAVGANVMVTVQVPAAASGVAVAQVPPWVKSPAAVPVSVNPVKVSGADPLLVTVTVCAALVVPTVCEAKVLVVAFSEMVG